MADMFSSQAHLYAKYRPSYPEDLYEYIFKYLNQKRSAWDCGTGSGQVAKVLADHFDQVYATDSSQKQLDHAPDRENVEYLQAPAEDSALAADSVDLVTVAQALHWFDFDRFYDEVKRVGRSGALLAAFGYGKLEVDQRIDPYIKQLYIKTFETYYSKPRSYLDKHYQTIPFPFEEIPAPSFQIALQWTLDDLEGYFNSWSTIQKFKSEKGYNPANETMELIRNRISPEEDLTATFPVFLRLGKVGSNGNITPGSTV